MTLRDPPCYLPPQRRAMEEVVIAGMSGKLPESENLQEFWANLIGGVDMVTDDDRRWKAGECPLGIRQQDGLRVSDQGTSGDGELPVELAMRLRTDQNGKGQVTWWSCVEDTKGGS